MDVSSSSTTEALFLAGCAGVIARILCVSAVDLQPRLLVYSWTSLILLMMLGGYLAAFVVHAETELRAFATGVCVDLIVLTIRKLPVHCIEEVVSDHNSGGAS